MNKKRQLFLIFIIFSFALSSISVWVENRYFKDSAQKVALDNAVKKSAERELVFQRFLQISSATITTLRQLNSFKRYLSGASNKAEVEEIFLKFINTQPDIMQMRYLDHEGFEKIRINRVQKKTFIVPKHALQSKSHRYYFYESKSRPLEQAWFSDLDLKMEQGQVDVPFVSTLRAVFPIEQDGSFAGVLVINYFMDGFLNKLLNAPLYDMILCDENGYIIKHYDSKKDWSRYQMHQSTILEEFGKEGKKLLGATFLKTKTFVSKKLNLRTKNDIYLILQLKHSYLKNQKAKSKTQYITISLIIFALSIAFSFIVVNFFSKTLLNLNEIKELNNNLKQLALRNNVALKASHVGIWEWNYKQNSFLWDEQMYAIYGTTKEEEKNPYQVWARCVDKADYQRVRDMLNRAVKERHDFDASFWITTISGERRYVRAFGTNEYDNLGSVVRVVGTNQDLTEQKLSKELIEKKNSALNASLISIDNTKKLLQAVMDSADDLIFYKDKELRYLGCNEAFLKFVGKTREEVEGADDFALFDTKHAEAFRRMDTHMLKENITNSSYDWATYPDGERVYLFTKKIPFIYDGTHLGVLGISRDLTQLHTAHKQIQEQTYIDELTKISNRKAYNKRIEILLHEFKQYGRIFSMIIYDIDYFKAINDTYGHKIGDRVLIEMSKMVQASIRQSDYIFRIGGEEFVILLRESNEENAKNIAQKVRHKIEHKLKTIKKHTITVSMGVTEVVLGDDEDSIFIRADESLYRAKNSGRNCVVGSSEK